VADRVTPPLADSLFGPRDVAPHPLDTLALDDPHEAVRLAYAMASGYREMLAVAVNQLTESAIEVARLRERVATLREEIRHIRRQEAA
jgi:hypothetical protein